jgi:imidazole glycerol phosphate synthase glutamine amidotransferase subunit
MIIIVDDGAGNLQSVKNALDKLGTSSLITDDREAILNADKVIFPGQGHFGSCVLALREKGLFDVIREVAMSKPFLGICVGMQLLFEESEEAPGIAGLAILRGEVKRFKEGQKLPQIGWNQIESIHGLDRQFFYFAHSYYCVPEDKKIITGSASYTESFPCMIETGKLLAVQFHPEKSGRQGLILLDKFIKGRQTC